jgi:galactose mutarotase-like enzyme
MIEQASINGLALHDEGTYKMEFSGDLDIVQADIRPTHPAHAIRIYDYDDELDIEIITDQPHVFSIAFLKDGRNITGFSIEPVHIPADKSLS